MKINITPGPVKIQSQFTKSGNIYRSGGFNYLRLKENPKLTHILLEENSCLFLNLGPEHVSQSDECFTAMIKHNVVMEYVGEAEIKTV